MSVMNMIQALNSAHHVMMERDPDTVVFGEDIGYFGGVFRVTEGLQKKFGSSRVFDAPIAEAGIVATAVGMAAYGLRPINEIQFADYIYPGYDQIVSEVARMRYRTVGEWDEERHAALLESLGEEVRAAQKTAEKLGTLQSDPYNDVDSMFEDVFAELPWHLREQRAQAHAEAEARRK